MPNGKKKKGHKMATHKRKKRLRKNRHKSKYAFALEANIALSRFVRLRGRVISTWFGMPLFVK